MGRDVDVAVLGATGVTGRRVVAYLASRARETNSRWVAAGRDPDKVRRVLAEEGVHEAEVVSVDIARLQSLKALAERARVVVNLVGPYAPMGREVVAAGVGAGAHYADLSGEMQFIRRVIREFDEAAGTAGVKVVRRRVSSRFPLTSWSGRWPSGRRSASSSRSPRWSWRRACSSRRGCRGRLTGSPAGPPRR